MNEIMNWAKTNCLVFMSDAGSENMSFHKMLCNNYGFTTLLHVTCGAHGLHNVAKLFPIVFPNANELIRKAPEIFSKAPTRRNRFRQLVNVTDGENDNDDYNADAHANAKKKVPRTKLPPKPIDTRFLSWLECCKYYTDQKNRDAVKKVMADFGKSKDKKLSSKATEVIQLIEDPNVLLEIETALKDYGNFIHAKNFFERKTATLVDMVRIVNSLENELNANETADQRIKEKFEAVFTKNLG